jgi:hypothetical protein
MRLVETEPSLVTMLLFRTWTAAPGELIRAPGVGRSATQPATTAPIRNVNDGGYRERDRGTSSDPRAGRDRFLLKPQ